jgi:hypothetical protein
MPKKPRIGTREWFIDVSKDIDWGADGPPVVDGDRTVWTARQIGRHTWHFVGRVKFLYWRGGFVAGLVVGLALGLALQLAPA